MLSPQAPGRTAAEHDGLAAEVIGEAADLGFGRIVVLEIEAPNMLANMV